MSECVVRMEMQKCCLDCPCVNGEYGYCQADKEERQIEDPNGRPSWCPIICSLPEGHGRLVDAEAAFAEIVKLKRSIKGYISEAGVYAALQEVPTIVPAERSET